MTDYDVIIVGARVAGSILAARLADRGHRVVVLDRATFPSPTLSTHFFRGAWCGSVLKDLDVLDKVLASGAPRLVREFHFEGSSEPKATPPQQPGVLGFSLSVRRETLDDILVRRARHAGADVRTPVRVRDIVTSGNRVHGVRLDDGTELIARVVVGADGRRSIVSSRVMPEVTMSTPPLRALYYRYIHGWRGLDGTPSLDAAEFSYVDGEVGYVFPSDGNVTCVAVSMPAERFGWFRTNVAEHFDERFRAHAGFASRFDASQFASKVFGTSPEPNWVRQAWGPGWALIGDAGVHQDPVAGLGIDSASQQADALARSLHRWFSAEASEIDAMNEFHKQRDQIAIPLFQASCGLAT